MIAAKIKSQCLQFALLAVFAVHGFHPEILYHVMSVVNRFPSSTYILGLIYPFEVWVGMIFLNPKEFRTMMAKYPPSKCIVRELLVAKRGYI